MKNWLKAIALLALVTGLVLALGGYSRPQVVDLVGVPWELYAPDVAPALFGVALIGWSVLTFVGASSGRRPVLGATVVVAIALGVWAVRLAGRFWFELASVTVAIGFFGVCLPAAVLLVTRAKQRLRYRLRNEPLP